MLDKVVEAQREQMKMLSSTSPTSTQANDLSREQAEERKEIAKIHAEERAKLAVTHAQERRDFQQAQNSAKAQK